MTDDYAETRKRYVQELRSSFAKEDTGRAAVHARLQAGAIEEHVDSLETVGSGALFQVRLLLAVMMFAAFILCDKTDTKLFSMTTDTLAEKVSENQKLPPQVSEVLAETLAAIK